MGVIIKPTGGGTEKENNYINDELMALNVIWQDYKRGENPIEGSRRKLKVLDGTEEQQFRNGEWKTTSKSTDSLHTDRFVYEGTNCGVFHDDDTEEYSVLRPSISLNEKTIIVGDTNKKIAHTGTEMSFIGGNNILDIEEIQSFSDESISTNMLTWNTGAPSGSNIFKKIIKIELKGVQDCKFRMSIYKDELMTQMIYENVTKFDFTQGRGDDIVSNTINLSRPYYSAPGTTVYVKVETDIETTVQGKNLGDGFVPYIKATYYSALEVARIDQEGVKIENFAGAFKTRNTLNTLDISEIGNSSDNGGYISLRDNTGSKNIDIRAYNNSYIKGGNISLGTDKMEEWATNWFVNRLGGNTAIIASKEGNGDLIISNNAYNDGFNWRNINDGRNSAILLTASGTLQYYNSSEGLANESSNEKLRFLIDENGTTKLGGIFRLAQFTTDEVNELTGMQDGDLIYNTTTKKILKYNSVSSAWEEYGSGGTTQTLQQVLEIGNQANANIDMTKKQITNVNYITMVEDEALTKPSIDVESDEFYLHVNSAPTLKLESGMLTTQNISALSFNGVELGNKGNAGQGYLTINSVNTIANNGATTMIKSPDGSNALTMYNTYSTINKQLVPTQNGIDLGAGSNPFGNIYTNEQIVAQGSTFGIVFNGATRYYANGFTSYLQAPNGEGKLRLQGNTVVVSGDMFSVNADIQTSLASTYDIGSNTNPFKSIYANDVYAPSDFNKKRDIKELPNAIIKILSNLKAVEFKWKNTELGEKKQIGFIAQEVEELFKQFGLEPSEYFVLNKNNDTYSLSYIEFIAMLTKYTQSLEERINILEKEVF